MTAGEWFAAAVSRLTAAGIEDAAFDARCLLEDFGGLPRGHAPRNEDITDIARLNAALEERVNGRPLQYVLGEWDFLSLTLAVGEGVLIPRPDTETLCEEAARRLSAIPAPRVLDLCAGSGCVGLGVASLCPGAQVTAVELFPEALAFLRENIARYPAHHVMAVVADVLTDFDAVPGEFDAILSNPPYIPAADLPGLQREVQREPATALDGGADGLRFYRVIAEKWISRLRPGGFVAVEVGAGQAEAVAALFAAAGLKNVTAVPDAAGILRVVAGEK